MNSTVHTVTKYLVNIPRNVGTNENYTSLPSTQTPPDIISHPSASNPIFPQSGNWTFQEFSIAKLFFAL